MRIIVTILKISPGYGVVILIEQTRTKSILLKMILEMKLTDKRFWKFEAMMLLCAVILLCQILVVLLCNGAEFESCNGAVLILLLPALCLYFAISGVPTWLVYKGNSWLRLAGWLYMFSAVLLIIPLLLFFYDWNTVTANIRPDNIPADEGKYFTDNEFIIMICAVWAALLIIPMLITSYLTKRWIVKRRPDITKEIYNRITG